MQKLSRNQLLTASAQSLARGIRSGSLSPSGVLEVHITRMKEVNPKVNGVFAERFDVAREEAAVLDEQQRSGNADFDSKPLFGVPCTIKEFI